MSRYLSQQLSWAVRRIRDLCDRSKATTNPVVELDPNTADIPNSSVLDLVWSAIVAGHASHGVSATLPQLRTMDADRDETVLSGLKDDPLTAEEWMSMYGRDDHIEEDILGAGTPLVYLYLFGWALGKHVTGWVVGGLPLALFWVWLAHRSMTSNNNLGELWLEDVAVFIMSVVFLASRIHARTPPSFKGSKGTWVAVLLEAVLANTLSRVAHAFGLIVEDPQGMPSPRIFIRLLKFSSLLGGWSFLSRVVAERQAAILRIKNLSNRRRGAAPEAPSSFIVQRYLMKIMDRSRDLRVTGLDGGELENLATILHNRGHREVGRYMRFFTRKGRAVDTFNLLFRFHRGYMNWKPSGEQNDHVSEWVEQHAASSFQSVDSILHIRDNTQDLSQELVRELQRTENRPSQADRSKQRELHRWWLCGAIASYLDHGGDMGSGNDNRSWYALTAAVLCHNRNALAVIAARKSARSVGSAGAKAMWPVMVEGCRQVLEQITSDERISSERGIVVAKSRPSKHSVVTYSPAEVWQAEQAREVIMFDQTTFAELSSAQPKVTRVHPSPLDDNSKLEILQNSLEMVSRVAVRVDFLPTMVHHRFQSLSLKNVRATAERGWLMHSVWVFFAIAIHFVCPQNLLFLSTFSFLATSVDRTNLQAHVVYVGVRLWRSWVGRIALWSPFADMDDTDMHPMAIWAYWTAVFVVNWVGVQFGTQPGLWCRICFLIILIGSIIPGFIYLGLGSDDDGADGSMRYIGRSTGPGYEHRERDFQTVRLHTPVGTRSLGKDVIVKDIDGNFTIASAVGQGREGNHVQPTIR